MNTEVKKEVTVSWHKLTDGVGLVFAGVLSMLEALDAGTAKDLMNYVSLGEKKEGEANDAEDAGAGTVDGDAGAVDAPVADTADTVTEEAEASVPKEEAAGAKAESTETTAEPATAKKQKATTPKTSDIPKEQNAAPPVTQDDITKIIVQKLKKDRSNNEKIGAILGTYGVAKVSELPAEKYEAFLTDLSQL